ncbi:MAG: 23S rRNA (adenine(2503)-C2)-methyltransferase, partial [Chloroflexi bacterium]|nr:23S rRNA (adenine(2503)-C2)-methyltransferase [Chloroflexota bacterium]
MAKWIYRASVFDFQRMTDLPLDLRQALAERAYVLPLFPLAELKSIDSATIKTLFELEDGHTIEAVLMSHDPTV